MSQKRTGRKVQVIKMRILRLKADLQVILVKDIKMMDEEKLGSLTSSDHIESEKSPENNYDEVHAKNRWKIGKE